ARFRPEPTSSGPTPPDPAASGAGRPGPDPGAVPSGRIAGRRRAARTGDRRRRVPLPGPGRIHRTAAAGVPAAVRRDQRHLSAAGRAAGPAGRPGRPVEGVRRRPSAAARLLPDHRRSAERTARGGGNPGPARHLLRRHRRGAQRAGRAMRPGAQSGQQDRRRADRGRRGPVRRLGRLRPALAADRPADGVPGGGRLSAGAAPRRRPAARPRGAGHSEGGRPMISGRIRITTLVGLSVLSLAAAGLYLYRASMRWSAGPEPTAASVHTDLATVLAGPHIVFRSSKLGPDYGRLAVAPSSDPDGPRIVADLDCERVYATAVSGACVAAQRGIVPSYRLILLDDRLRPTAEDELTG